MRAPIRAISAFGLMLLTNAAFASSTLYYEDFDDADFPWYSNYVDADGNLGSEWSFYTDTYGTSYDQGLIEIYDWGGSHGGVLLLHDGVNDSKYSLNEAILSVDLFNKTDVTLSFQMYDSEDEQDPIGNAEFEDHKKADGVAVSGNGTDWFPLVEFYNHDNDWRTYTASISDLIAANSALQLTSTFLIKFQQYDNRRHGDDGRKFDKIKIKGDMAPSSQPGVVPEPATATLFGIGLIGMAACCRRRRRRR